MGITIHRIKLFFINLRYDLKKVGSILWGIPRLFITEKKWLLNYFFNTMDVLVALIIFMLGVSLGIETILMIAGVPEHTGTNIPLYIKAIILVSLLILLLKTMDSACAVISGRLKYWIPESTSSLLASIIVFFAIWGTYIAFT